MTMNKSIVVVDCDDPQLAEEICSALADYTEVEAVLPSHPSAQAAHYASCWFPHPELLTHCPHLKLVQAASAGVDHLPEALFTSDVPLCRVVDDNFRHGMFEYALWGVLHFQRYFDRAIHNQQQKRWQLYAQRPSHAFRVGIMGLGEIGSYLASQFASLGYPVSGWARSEKTLAGVDCFAGPDQLDAFCHNLDVLINVLPLTAQTHGILGTPLLNRLPQGTALINCGRGDHMVNHEVIAALDSGQLGGAVIDVFPIEPLPSEDPMWTHPNVIVTPHMASSAQVSVIVSQLIDNIARVEQHRPLRNHVDKHHGY